MKHFKSLVIGLSSLVCLSSCMYADGNSQTGDWRIAAVGTDIKKHDIGADGWTADDVNNSVATKEIATGAVKRARDALMFGLAGKGLDAASNLGGEALKTLK